MTKEEKKSKKIITDNRKVTINKREISYQGLALKFENGEDGIFNLIANDKNIIFTPKISITQQDLIDIPYLKLLREAIKSVQIQEKKALGRRRFLLKKQLIEMRQDQYVIKNSFKQPIYCSNGIKSFNSLNIDDKIIITPDGRVQDQSLISLTNPAHISVLLCNYSRLKEDCYDKFYTDGYYLMWDLDNLIERALKDEYPLYYRLLIYKIDKKQNKQIQELLEDEFDIKYSVEYISSLWRKKIPKLIAAAAQQQYLEWYYTQKERGVWKKCSRCGKIKLAHNKFFSKNGSSKDGFYSICKSCRNSKTKKKRDLEKQKNKKEKKESKIIRITKRVL